MGLEYITLTEYEKISTLLLDRMYSLWQAINFSHDGNYGRQIHSDSFMQTLQGTRTGESFN